MGSVKTNWTEATQDLTTAIVSLLAAIESGRHAWIEIRKNGNQEFPILKKNPVLDNPFAWESLYGTVRKDTKPGQYFNETEKDLAKNWVACFGTEEAVQAYEQEGRIIEGLISRRGGIAHPVRIDDANAYRKQYWGEEYHYEYWKYEWAPKKGIPYEIVDESIGDVFVICTDDQAPDKMNDIRKAAKFLNEYAEKLEREEENERKKA